MTLDQRGVPVSSASPEVLETFETALEQAQSYFGDAVATIDTALAQQPQFVLGHIFKAGLLMTLVEKRFTDIAREHIVAAEKLLSKANDRERGLARAVRQLVDGNFDAAAVAFDDVLVEYPRDVIALQIAHIFDFMRGDALNLRNRVLRVLPHWSASVPGYSYVKGLMAFGFEEANQYPEAEAAGREALSLNPRDPWAVHAVTHVMEMQGRIEEGINWLESREQDWAGDNFLAPHNWWHLALFHLDRERTTRVLELYDRGVFATPSDMSMMLLDATSLLWRMHVLGHDYGDRMQAQADYWQAKIETETGFYAFNDAHAVMALGASGREGAANEVLRRLEASAKGDTQQAEMARIGLAISRGLLAFAREDYALAVDQLHAARDTANRFGGSHAQRDFITLTLVEAAIRGKRHSLARHILAERNVAKPGSALGWRLLARAQ